MAHGQDRPSWGRTGCKRHFLQIQVSALKNKGEIIDPAVEKKLLDEIKGRYEKQTTPIMRPPVYGVDAIIDPYGHPEGNRRRAAGRQRNNTELPEFKTGVDTGCKIS